MKNKAYIRSMDVTISEESSVRVYSIVASCFYNVCSAAVGRKCDKRVEVPKSEVRGR